MKSVWRISCGDQYAGGSNHYYVLAGTPEAALQRFTELREATPDDKKMREPIMFIARHVSAVAE